MMKMNEHDKRLRDLDAALGDDEDVCAVKGVLHDFPEHLYSPYWMSGIGLIVCLKGSFDFDVNDSPFHAKAGQSVFLASDVTFLVTKTSSDLAYRLLFFHVAPIRDMLGSSVLDMRMHSMLSPGVCDVWQTGQEHELTHYVEMLASYRKSSQTPYDDYEQKLLLMALTYRLCSIYQQQLGEYEGAKGRKQETFVNLMKLVKQYYMRERGVSFYADRLCLSPKYLSALAKEVSGYSVQEILFREVVRKSIFLMKNTNMTILEIASLMNFPNASAFGTFFKKQTGLSPRNYRNNGA